MNNDLSANMESLREKAKREIGEVEEEIPEKINQLKKLIAEGDDKIILHPPSFDYFYLRCLRARKYNLQRAAELYTRLLRLSIGVGATLVPHMVPSEHADLYKNKLCSVSRTRDKFGREVFIVRIEKWIASETSFEKFLASMFMLLHQCLVSIDTQLHGLVVIVDLKTLSLSHLALIRPGSLQSLIHILQGSYPARFKEFHLVNNPRIFSLIYNVAKPLFTEKMKKRIHFHGSDKKSLHNALKVHPDFLPEFLGGTLSDENYDDLDIPNRLIQKNEHFKEFHSYGYQKK